MVRKSTAALGATLLAVAAVGGQRLYQRYTTEQMPYTVVARLEDAELRRYPPAVVAETVASSENRAFRRLFRYIDGANQGAVDLAMTAPVEVAGRGTEIPMTTPVETDTEGPEAGVRMAFFLPAEYDADSAPEPTDDAVSLRAVPERTLAVRQFSWWPSDGRVAREREALLAALDRAGVETAGAPVYMGYDAPWTLPFLRRNEVAVEVAAPDPDDGGTRTLPGPRLRPT